MLIRLQGGPSARGLAYANSKFEVTFRNKIISLSRPVANLEFNVNMSFSASRWTTPYMSSSTAMLRNFPNLWIYQISESTEVVLLRLAAAGGDGESATAARGGSIP